MNFVSFFTLAILTVLAFFITNNPLTEPFKLQLTLVVLIAFLLSFFALKRKTPPKTGYKIFAYLVTTFILFLVASTGWFFSPFFFILYLLAIFLAFILNMGASLGLIVSLVALFSFNIGEVDLTYDFLTILSLISVIPLSFYLRREFLRLQEAEKEILVLKAGEKEYKDKIEEILANTVNNFAVNLRQPINDIKQLAYLLSSARTKEKTTQSKERLIASTEEALRMLKDFEEAATGKKLLTTPKNSSLSQPTDQG